MTGPSDRLSRREAEERGAAISDVAYDLALSLEGGTEGYRGEAALSFSFEGEAPTFLDFSGGAIERLEVNGRAVEPQWEGHRIHLPQEWLESDNRVQVGYRNRYDYGGEGFHQFVDPQDGREYLYTHLEPYQAHRVLPCFDQPDLKATYRLVVDAPDQWQVASSAVETASERLRADRRRHLFERSLPFSPYLLAVVAGPYHVVGDHHRGLPLRLFCRGSLRQFLEPDELLEITRQGLDFYADFFDCPYPFTKYDQLFVPEFNWGGMENVAAVTYSEQFLFRDRPTQNDRLRRAEVLLHELAHMWFGDLVTMRWWDDLWLNESFATYMAYLAVEEATRFSGSWQNFHSRMKVWAYRQDELVTTHQIAGEVPTTDDTFLNFDGITYGKGAAVIKQLVASTGADGFREGMRRYFRRHAFDNATLNDFLRALQEGSGLDLESWARTWLQTRSLNRLWADWEAGDGRLDHLRLRQSAPPDFPELRPHYLEVAVVADRDGGLSVHTLPLRLEGEAAEVPEAGRLPAPRMVVPNHGDHAYAKVSLDPRTLAAAKSLLAELADPLLRQLLWSSMWMMVRDRELRSTEFLQLVRRQLVLEQDLQVLQMVIALAAGDYTARSLAPEVLDYYVPPSARQGEAHRFFRSGWEALRRTSSSDAQALWLRGMIGQAISQEDLELAGRLVDGKEEVPGLDIDQEMRWEVAIRWMAHGVPGSDERLAAERRRDGSDRGQRALMRAEAARPSPEVKAEVWERIHRQGYGSLHLMRAAMSGFGWWHQRELLGPYLERFFRGLPEVFATWEREAAKQYFLRLFPWYRLEEDVLRRARELLGDVGDQPMLQRLLREAVDDLERALACRAYASSPSSRFS